MLWLISLLHVSMRACSASPHSVKLCISVVLGEAPPPWGTQGLHLPLAGSLAPQVRPGPEEAAGPLGGSSHRGRRGDPHCQQVLLAPCQVKVRECRIENRLVHASSAWSLGSLGSIFFTSTLLGFALLQLLLKFFSQLVPGIGTKLGSELARSERRYFFLMAVRNGLHFHFFLISIRVSILNDYNMHLTFSVCLK